MVSTVNIIVDFGNIYHINYLVESSRDLTVHHSIKAGLKLTKVREYENIYTAAKKEKSILQGTVHAELISAAKDGNQLVAIAITSHVMNMNCTNIPSMLHKSEMYEI